MRTCMYYMSALTIVPSQPYDAAERLRRVVSRLETPAIIFKVTFRCALVTLTNAETKQCAQTTLPDVSSPQSQ